MAFPGPDSGGTSGSSVSFIEGIPARTGVRIDDRRSYISTQFYRSLHGRWFFEQDPLTVTHGVFWMNWGVVKSYICMWIVRDVGEDLEVTLGLSAEDWGVPNPFSASVRFYARQLAQNRVRDPLHAAFAHFAPVTPDVWIPKLLMSEEGVWATLETRFPRFSALGHGLVKAFNVVKPRFQWSRCITTFSELSTGLEFVLSDDNIVDRPVANS